jgi:DNA replication and repair protein RecF
MRISNLKLINFRNFTSLDIEFNSNINIFIGKNAQGKTSLLESIYLLSISKSHKTFKDKEMIKFNTDYAKVTSNIVKSNDLMNLEIVVSNQGKKVTINSIEKKKISEYIGAFNVVMFAPEDLDIIKRDPSTRRKFLDIEIGQTSSIYLFNLSQYNKILKQRNEFLKQSIQSKVYNNDYLDILTIQLVEFGIKIVKKRNQFIEKLNQYANKLHYFISNKEEQLRIEYASSFSEKLTTEQVFNLYKRNYNNDIKRGTTQIGIHRDDLKFYLNGVDVGSYGSQGQQRTTALSVKLSLIDFIKDETSYYPIVLLDDVLSELDDIRQSLLLDCIKEKVQTFVTTTNVSGIKSEIITKSDIFVIENAKITHKKEGVKYVE